MISWRGVDSTNFRLLNFKSTFSIHLRSYVFILNWLDWTDSDLLKFSNPSIQILLLFYYKGLTEHVVLLHHSQSSFLCSFIYLHIIFYTTFQHPHFWSPNSSITAYYHFIDLFVTWLSSLHMMCPLQSHLSLPRSHYRCHDQTF